MNRAWLKLMFGFMACIFLIGYGTCFAQTEQTQGEPQKVEEEGTQTVTQQTAAPAPQPKAGELPPPLEAEMVIAEHWSKNPYPRSMAAGSRVHIVQKGDTLWDLAGRYYNNPFLWPQIWDANKYIPNAHWIYPGDPIAIPPLTPISEEQIAKETATEPTGEPTGGGPVETGGPVANVPVGLDFDLYCSGFIVNTVDGWKNQIVASEQNVEQVSQSLFDIIYLNQGEAEGVSPGDEFTVIHYVRPVSHPITLKRIGDYVVQTGRVKVVATQEHTSTAQVTYSCDASLVGDYVIPFQPKEVPTLSNMPPIDRFSPDGPGIKGYVVFAKDDLGSLGTNYELQIDLGTKDGVNVGSRLLIYRFEDRGYDQQNLAKYDLPRRVLGEMVVFSVEDATATGRIISSFDYVRIGDRVEVR
jgi:LysM domain